MHRSPFAIALAALAVGCSSQSETLSVGPRARSSAVEASAPKQAPSGDILPFEATETTLDNGLKVIVVPTGFPNLVSLQIPVQTGSRNEVEEGKTGFAHFFEHMMFRGTDNYSPAEYEAIMTKAGARQNAYTTSDYTNYHVTFAKEDLEKILEIEADRFQNLSYPEDSFRTEALAVLGEYNKNYANPIRKMLEVTQNAAYTTHTYKHTTMGFLDDIIAMPDQMEYAQTFFDRWYRPEYATVMVVGDVTPEEVIPLVEKYFGPWERGDYEVEIPQEPPPQGPVYAHVPWDSQTLPIVAVGFHGPAFSETETDSAALSMVQELFFGDTSDLYKRLVVDEQVIDSLGAWGGTDQDPSLSLVFARVKMPDVAEGEDAGAAVSERLSYVRDAILATAAEARTRPVDADRLADAKSNIRYSFARGLDSSDRIGSILARFVRFRRSYDSLNNAFKVSDSLTPEDLLAAAREYYTDERLVVTTVAHEELDADVASIPSLARFTPAADDGPATDLEILLQRTPSTQLSMRLAFETGSADDPEGKEGLAAISAAMITEAGSADMRYEDIQKTLFPVAGGFGNQVDREMTVFAGSIHKDNLELYADTVLAQLLEPGFREDDFDRVRQAARNALVQDLRTNNDEELGKEVLQADLFAGTPYGHPTQGTVAGIDSITLDDVREFVAKNYTRANLTVGLAGDVPEWFEERLKDDFAALPAGRVTGPGLPPRAARPDGIDVHIVEKNTLATAISMGFPIDVKRGHSDFPALYLARTWLGEHRSSMSHLYQRIREVRGMNYGDYAYIEAFPRGMFQFFPDANIPRRAQLFEIWIRPVKPEQAHHAIRIALHELEDLVENGLTQEEFEATREYLSKNVFLATATQSAILGYALDSQFYDIPEYTKYMRDGLERLTLRDVNNAIRRHLSADDMHVVCITQDAAALAEQLLSDEPSSIAYASEKPAELLEEDREIGARKLNLTEADVRVSKVEEIFAE